MKIFKNREKKQIFLSVFLFVVVIALYIELNVILEKANIPDIDITEEKIFSISDSSKNKIQRLNSEVNIKLVNFEKYNNYAYLEDIYNLMDKYQKLNNKINIETYEEETAETSSYPYIIFSCGDKQKIVFLNDMYAYKYNTLYECEEEYYISESEITNSILSVANNINDKVYIYLEKSAYNEKIFTSLINRINGLGMDAYELVLSENMSIPNDCRCIIIPPLIQTSESGEANAVDLSEEEKDLIVAYINDGGNILFLQESKSVMNGETPNLDYIMGLYGIHVSDGIILDESNRLQNNAGYIFPNVNYNSKVYESLDEKARICMVDASKIVTDDEETLKSLNVQHEILLKSSDSAYWRKDISNTNLSRCDNDIDAKNSVLGICAQKSVNGNTSKAIVYANSVFALNSPIFISDSVTKKKLAVEMIMIDSNEELIANSIKYLSDNSDTVYIQKNHYNIVPSTNIITDGITLKIIFVIPLIVIFIGYFVWRYRKNKK